MRMDLEKDAGANARRQTKYDLIRRRSSGMEKRYKMGGQQGGGLI